VRASLAFLLLAGTIGGCDCNDGGWNQDFPDTVIGKLPDSGGGDPAGEATDTGADDPGANTDGGEIDAAPGDVVWACGEGPGNELGVGRHCTVGGGECGESLLCDKDMDAKGAGACILVGCSGDADCGTGATCCHPKEAPEGLMICIIDPCLPPECKAPPPDTDETAPDADVVVVADVDIDVVAEGEPGTDTGTGTDTEGETGLESETESGDSQVGGEG
jgi:hypothetical protein